MTIDISKSIPQGSILVPLLVSIYINDLITLSDKLHFIISINVATINFNFENFDKFCIEAEITNELEKKCLGRR